MCAFVEIAHHIAHAQAFLSRSQTAILSPGLKMALHSQVRFTPHVDYTIFASLHKSGAKRVLLWKRCYSIHKLAQTVSVGELYLSKKIYENSGRKMKMDFLADFFPCLPRTRRCLCPKLCGYRSATLSGVTLSAGLFFHIDSVFGHIMLVPHYD